MNNDVKIIMERINKLFKRAPHTLYHIQCTKNIYDEQFNFFFIIQPKGRRQHSIPLHTIDQYTLEYLQLVIKLLRKQTQLSIEYIGFTEKDYWPNSFDVIQKKKRWDE
ncbi:hypothetical protein [Furfurilactobacillus siliginis]|uniref:Acetyl-CoA carboxylase n=1 Tax=Furfurilactobacillus siliginis TaxID=348151 RepID=A0A510VNM0_9LACO|nr:hypothetical protein [Furfurilactobacillus siliginis]GEK28532.1 hypothetical protein LSI01_08430 [Furfurilactobacillus siliginis]